MAKYINFDIAVRKLGTWYKDLAEANGNDDDFVKGYGEAMDDLADVPAADVQEVKHGKWISDKKREGIVICSECKRGECCDWFRYKYCYECGSKMDLEDKQ